MLIPAGQMSTTIFVDSNLDILMLLKKTEWLPFFCCNILHIGHMQHGGTMQQMSMKINE